LVEVILERGGGVFAEFAEALRLDLLAFEETLAGPAETLKKLGF
jgi:hypothetical protein